MRNSITWVGFDDAARRINVAVFVGNEANPHEEFAVENDSKGHSRLIRKLKTLPGEVRCVYEAGVNGYHLHRVLKQKGIPCDVAAPSLTPRRAGNRVKTDRRDAKMLAKLYRAGELTSIAIPGPEQESLRDLVRAREDAMEDQQRCRHRLSRFLLRRGIRFTAAKAWSRPHMKWMSEIRLDDPMAQAVLDDYRMALLESTERMKGLEEKIGQAAKAPQYQKLIGYLMGLKGVRELTAMTILAEAIDLKRFSNPRALMAAIGLVPSERSSGERELRGGITKTGNSHMRRVLVESAWNYRHRPVPGKWMRKRRAGLPQEVREIVHSADKRLNRRYWYLVHKGKDSRTAAVAVARELAGFIWSIGQVA